MREITAELIEQRMGPTTISSFRHANRQLDLGLANTFPVLGPETLHSIKGPHVLVDHGNPGYVLIFSE